MATIHRRMPRTPQRRNAQINTYKRNTQRIYLINISHKYDQDVIDWLEENKPYQTAIKWLVREQIKREEEEMKAMLAEK